MLQKTNLSSIHRSRKRIDFSQATTVKVKNPQEVFKSAVLSLEEAVLTIQNCYLNTPHENFEITPAKTSRVNLIRNVQNVKSILKSIIENDKSYFVF